LCVCVYTHISKPVVSEYRHHQLPNLSVCYVHLTVATDNGQVESFEVFVLLRRLSGWSLRDVSQSASGRSVTAPLSVTIHKFRKLGVQERLTRTGFGAVVAQ